MAKSTTSVLPEKPVVAVFCSVSTSQSAQKLLRRSRVGVDWEEDTLMRAKQQIAIASYVARCSQCTVLKKLKRTTSDGNPRLA